MDTSPSQSISVISANSRKNTAEFVLCLTGILAEMDMHYRKHYREDPELAHFPITLPHVLCHQLGPSLEPQTSFPCQTLEPGRQANGKFLYLYCCCEADDLMPDLINLPSVFIVNAIKLQRICFIEFATIFSSIKRSSDRSRGSARVQSVLWA